ncbi:MAG: hypothetical protein RL654_1789 [Pseudomonadota bacterium]|jgi:transcriptional regulator of acetoin/glycerol metabolism
MNDHGRPAGGKAPRLRPLKQILLRGETGPASLPIDPVLQRSWQRSLEAGLTPAGLGSAGPHASAVQLARARDRHHALIDHARPVLEFLFEQTRGTDSVVLLADAQGMLLDAIGDTDFSQRAARVALRPGAVWHEQWRGTNAIGTCLAEEQALVIHGDEHFLDRNGFLTCAASPIVDPSGRIVGAIDISGDQRHAHRHTLGLVRSAARMIEQRLFETHHAHGLRLRFHPRREGIASLTEGLVALSDDGWVIGANAAGLSMLGLERGHIGALRADSVFGLDLRSIEAMARVPTEPRALRCPDGTLLWLRVDRGHSIEIMARRTDRQPEDVLPAPSALPASPHRPDEGPSPPGGPSLQVDALSGFERGDPTLRQIVIRLRRLGGTPVGLVLQGESGCGKSTLARAVHLSGPRRDGPLQTLHCASLDGDLLDDSLFGRPLERPPAPGLLRRARGGTLVLDEVADLPLPLQARLLRVLQDDMLTPLPGEPAQPLDVALICTSRRRLIDEVACGRLREDLYYRLNGLTLILPPLRERSDLAALCRQLLDENGSNAAVDPGLLERLMRYPWPGNGRQLANALRAASVQLEPHERSIRLEHLPDDLREELAQLARQPQAQDRNRVERPPLDAAEVMRTVAGSKGNLSEAARRLGISRNTLYRRLREAGAAGGIGEDDSASR